MLTALDLWTERESLIHDMESHIARARDLVRRWHAPPEATARRQREREGRSELVLMTLQAERENLRAAIADFNARAPAALALVED